LADGASAKESHDLIKDVCINKSGEQKKNDDDDDDDDDDEEEEEEEDLYLETIISVVLRVKGKIVIVQDKNELKDYNLKFRKQNNNTRTIKATSSSNTGRSSSSSSSCCKEKKRLSPIITAVARKSSKKKAIDMATSTSPITTLYVFDFDQTLFFTPNKDKWEKLHSKQWNSDESSWPRDPRSLSGDMYQHIKVGPSFNDLIERKDIIKSPNVYCIVSIFLKNFSLSFSLSTFLIFFSPLVP
jgi:hypothetical protein